MMPGALARMRYPDVVFKEPQETLPTFDILLLWRDDEDRPEILRLIESIRGRAVVDWTRMRNGAEGKALRARNHS